MKKLLMIMGLAMAISSCAVNSTTTKTYPRLTAENLQQVCEATESWNLRVMPMPVSVVRFGSGCGGIRDLLVVVTPNGDPFTEAQRRLTVELALTYYVQYLEREKPAENGERWQANFLKKEVDTEREFWYHEVVSEK